MRLQPKSSSIVAGIDSSIHPPVSFVAATMDLAMVSPAQRYGELIAHLASECLRLREPKMVGIRRLAAADQAWLFCDEPNVVLIPNAPWLWQGKRAFVDTARTRLLTVFGPVAAER
jgi:hypothetical protein